MRANRNRIEARFDYRLPDGVLTSLYLYLEESSEKRKGEKAYLSKDEEKELLISYIYNNDLFYNPLPFATYLDEGAEQRVFLQPEMGNVIKLNDAIFYVNWSQYFESLLVHNILFPETAYDFNGFVIINDVLYAVVSQAYIESSSPTSIEAVRALMKENGFIVKKNNDYINNELGLIIEDLHEENVLTREDVLFMIDTIIYLK